MITSIIIFASQLMYNIIWIERISGDVLKLAEEAPLLRV